MSSNGAVAKLLWIRPFKSAAHVLSDCHKLFRLPRQLGWDMKRGSNSTAGIGFPQRKFQEREVLNEYIVLNFTQSQLPGNLQTNNTENDT